MYLGSQTSLPTGMPLPRAAVRPMTLAIKALRVKYSFSTTPLRMVFNSGIPEPETGEPETVCLERDHLKFYKIQTSVEPAGLKLGRDVQSHPKPTDLWFLLIFFCLKHLFSWFRRKQLKMVIWKSWHNLENILYICKAEGINQAPWTLDPLCDTGKPNHPVKFILGMNAYKFRFKCAKNTPKKHQSLKVIKD